MVSQLILYFAGNLSSYASHDLGGLILVRTFTYGMYLVLRVQCIVRCDTDMDCLPSPSPTTIPLHIYGAVQGKSRSPSVKLNAAGQSKPIHLRIYGVDIPVLGLTWAEITFGMVIGCLAWRLWLSFDGIGLASREHDT